MEGLVLWIGFLMGSLPHVGNLIEQPRSGEGLHHTIKEFLTIKTSMNSKQNVIIHDIDVQN